MKLTREEVLKIAKLARLHLEEEDIAKYQEDLGSILTYVEKLQELNTDDVPEFQHAAGGVNNFREDIVENCDEDTRRRAIENFSEREGDLLKVQAVFENRTE
ncbi:Asp-tRNA(Asn)/Glu-tRNA(Gln) amidotransferase subunit GatC [Patescibacteria group bacterium]|nr:MAG: Asp-tRNA(Asn)/Glu-tRNA(Gln) amidotransferase subunit GatC [Patescibacteria group bacterium]